MTTSAYHESPHPSAVHASLGFLLAAAVEELYPGQQFYIEHSFVGGYYCHMGSNRPVTPEILRQLTGKLTAYLNGDEPLEFLHLDRETLRQRFEQQCRSDKLEILQRLGCDPVPVARFRHYLDYRFEPMTHNRDHLRHFSLDPYDHGLLLRFPSLLPPYEVPPMKDSPKLYQVIQQREDWGRVLHVKNLSQLNRQLEGGQFRELIWVAEGLHEKTIAQIADELCAAYPGKRVVFVSGPSSSGKTTFAKRLAIQLKVNGHNTLALSMDDYFMDHGDMVPQPDGALDFEDIAAINVDLLIAEVNTLLGGGAVPRRQYSFKEGRGKYGDEHISLENDAFLIIEGIHGLNPVFSNALGAVQRIYISALTQLNVDNEHRVSSSDNRLLRRLVRDAQFRGYNAEETLLRWPDVRRGEERHIFTYQEEADYMFNSSLIYELAALRPKAEEVLQAVPAASAAHGEAQRLLTFLSFIANVNPGPIPRISIIREFIGGSAFDY